MIVDEKGPWILTKKGKSVHFQFSVLANLKYKSVLFLVIKNTTSNKTSKNDCLTLISDQYRAKPACTSVQSNQAVNNFKFSS